MKVNVEKQPKSTIKLTITVPQDKVKEAYDHILTHFAENAEIEGFRKGKAPKELVEKKVKQADLSGETVNHLLQEFYVAALKEHKIAPIGNPKVVLKKFDKNSEFEFEATVAIRPEIKLDEYRGKLKKAYEAKNKDSKEAQDLEINEVIDVIREASKVEISDLLVEDEVTRMLSRLLEQSEALGLSIDQYLSAQNKKAEDLKKEYEEVALKNLKAEFALAKAIEDEKIEVTDTEIDEAIAAVPDERLRTQLQNSHERWYIRSILAKNKLLKKLVDETSTKSKNTEGSKKEDIKDEIAHE